MKHKITYQNVYHTKEFYRRFLSSLSDRIDAITICSPYFNKLPKPFDSLLFFCRHIQGRGDARITIVTRPPGADINAIPLEVAKRLAASGVEIFIRPRPFLHAKMYHIEYTKGYFRSFVGSANFTLGGFEKNHELVAELEGVGDNSPCDRELARLTGPGALTLPIWIKQRQPSGDQETI